MIKVFYNNMNTQDIKRLIKMIWQNTSQNSSLRIYGLLDAARDQGIYPQVRDNAPTAQSLFQGSRARELALVAPYLVPLAPDDFLTTWFLQHGWGDKWGILCETSETLTELRRHFQRVFAVYNDAGKPLYFRFYDPRVLEDYLQSATPSELKKIFGSVQSFYVEGDDAGSLTQYLLAADRIVKRSIELPISG